MTAMATAARTDTRMATVMPPAPAFYHQPQTIEDLLNQTVGKLLDQFDLSHELYRRWEGR